MVKLQMFKKSDGGSVFHVNIPIAVIIESCFRKGDNLEVECTGLRKICISEKK